MTFATGSMTSANPAADLYTALASALTTAGFTLEDTVVISTRTHKVWKSAAANNSQGLDWYLDVAYTTTGAGQVWFGAFEGYNSTTHVGTRGPYNASSDSNNPEATYYSRYGASASALETNWTTISNSIAHVQTQTTAYAYWFSATTDRVICMTSVQPTHIYYCGFFDMYEPWENKIGGLAYPLITCTVNQPNATNGHHSQISNMPTPPTVAAGAASPTALTRVPPVATLYDSNGMRWSGARIYSIAAENIGGAASPVGGLGYGGPTGQIDIGGSAYHDAPRGGKLGVFNNWALNAQIAIGTLKDLNVFASATATRGDTIEVSGTDWVVSNTVSNRVYGFKAI